MSDGGSKRRLFQPAVAVGLLAAAIGILSGWDGAIAKLEAVSPHGAYLAPFVGSAAVFLLCAAIFWLVALAWRPFFAWRDRKRRTRAEDAERAAASRAEIDAKRDLQRLRLSDETQWLYAWVSDQVQGGFRSTNPLEIERANLARERLVDEGLLDSWGTVNLDLVSREIAEKLAKIIAHLKQFSISESVDRLRQS